MPCASRRGAQGARARNARADKVIRIIARIAQIGIILETEADEDYGRHRRARASGDAGRARGPGGPQGGRYHREFKGEILTGPNPGADEDESAPAPSSGLTKRSRTERRWSSSTAGEKETKTGLSCPA